MRRAALAVICVAVLLGSMVGWVRLGERGVIGYAGYVDRPEEHDGEQVALSLVRVARLEGPDRYVVEKGATAIPVHGPTAGLVRGEDISVGGRWDAEQGWLEQQWIERRHGGRQAKRWLGLGGLALVFALVGGAVRPGTGGLVLRG